MALAPGIRARRPGVRVAGLVSALLYGFADLPRTWGGRVAFLVLAPPLTLLLEVLGERMLAIVVLLGPLLW